MGKWLDRVIEKKAAVDKIYRDMPKDRTDKTDKTPTSIPFIPPKGDSENPNLTILDHLDETSKEAFREYVDLMTGPKFKMPLEQARTEASQLVLRNLRTLQLQQAAKDYRKYGWVKIYSTALEQTLYLAEDQGAARRVSDKDIPVFLESDIDAVKGLGPEMAKVLLEARLIFNGPLMVEDHVERLTKRKVDGKQIARNFYGKENG